MDTAFQFDQDEIEALLEAVQSKFEQADNEEDQQFWSDLNEKLGGDNLMDEDA